jgi:nicotinamidase/pyrazinamidase
MNALIIVDLQNDFIPAGALAVPEGDQIVPLINQLQPCFDLVVATQDWHPANHGSFAVNHPGRKLHDTINLNGLPQVLWPAHCVQHTPGAELVNDLNRDRIAKVFQKGTDPAVDSYSGFFDNGHRHATGLADFLRAQGVTDVHIVGLATDYCVKFTALDAVAEGFRTILIKDACRGVNVTPGDVDRAVAEMKRNGAMVLNSKEIKA